MAACGRRARWWGAVLAAVLAWATSPAGAQTEIRLSLEGSVSGTTAPMVVAQEKGYFRQQGLAVEMSRAANVLEPITRVASGEFDLGIADLNAVLRWRDQNAAAALRPIFILHDQAAYAILARRSRGIKLPRDLEGKRLGAPVGAASSAIWPIFARLNNIDAAKVTVETVALPVRDPMLAAGQVDAVTTLSFHSFIDLKHRGVPLDDLLLWRMYEYGVRLYGDAVIVNGKFATEQPEAVRGFLLALIEGLRETVRDPAAAIDLVLQRHEIGNRETEFARLQMALRENILTPAVQAHGIGGADPVRLQIAVEQLALVYRFKTQPTPSQAFDPSFLPAAELRRIN